MEAIKFLLISSLKRYKVRKISAGFTLIELLVAMILAFLVITPLLTFVINITDTESKEQAKISSEQEIQTAMEYITRDLQQAVYIYDRTGIATLTNNYNSTTCSGSSTGCSQLPASADKIPVLVFWKRNFMSASAPINSTTTCTSTTCNDSFVYSLVAYYLNKSTNSNWSNALRIERFEIKDGVKKPDGTYVNESDTTIGRDQGFNMFSVNPNGNIATQMNAWTKKTSETYGAGKTQVLVDYIDQSNLTTNPDSDSALKLPREVCPGDVTTPTPTDPDWKQVPDYTNTGVAAAFKTYSFYTCPYSAKNTVKVFLRGNALIRINNTTTNSSYKNSNSSYFPSAKIEIKGIGAIGGS